MSCHEQQVDSNASWEQWRLASDGAKYSIAMPGQRSAYIALANGAMSISVVRCPSLLLITGYLMIVGYMATKWRSSLLSRPCHTKDRETEASGRDRRPVYTLNRSFPNTATRSHASSSGLSSAHC